MNQLISQVLGIRRLARGLVIDPVLPNRLHGLQLNFRLMDRPVTFVYHLGQGERRVEINGEKISAQLLHNPYRRGGFYIEEERLSSRLTPESNRIDVYL